MDINNGLIVQYGRFVRSEGKITSLHSYTGTFPISFPNNVFSGTCVTNTANGVVGADFNNSNGATVEWSIKPNHDNTANTICYFIAIGN